MTEILTESFCERCGTRYTFETAAPRKSRIGRVKTVSRGVRNYVLQDESSFSEAMADARSEDEHTATAHQLDAFHKTFNFCMTCRQYTCGNCWNTGEGRCLTCSPLPESEMPALPLAAAVALPLADVAAPAAIAANGHEAWPDADQPESWPEADLTPDRLARALGVAAAADAVDEPTETADAPDSAAALRGVAPGQSLEDAVAAYEAQVAAEEDAELEAIEAVAALEADALAADFDEDRPLAALAAVAAVEAVADEQADEAPVQVVADEVAVEAVAVEAVAVEAVAVEVAVEAPGADEVAEEAAEDEVEPDAVAAGAVAAAAIAAGVVSDSAEADEPEPSAAATDEVVEPTRDRDLGRVAAAAAAAVLWPVDDDEPEPVAARADEPQPVPAQPQPEPVAPEPEPEPVAADAEPEPDLLPLAAAAAAAAAVEGAGAREDVIVQPTWPVETVATPAAAAGTPEAPVAPALETPAAPPVQAAPVIEPEPVPAPIASPQAPAPPAASPWLTVAPDDGVQPEWPAAAQWGRTTSRSDIPATLAGRQLIPRDDAAAVWAASAREVLTGGAANAPASVPVPIATPQPCVSCGLSLSANARFCRRCGTRQP